ncbi:hypothetical protein M9458_024744, partial [Cirrhinus mrigala]
SSFFGRKLTRVPPILSLHGLSLPTEQMQPLSLTMKPPPLLSSSQHQHQHLSMAPPPPLALLDNSGAGKTSGSAHNGSLDPSDAPPPPGPHRRVIPTLCCPAPPRRNPFRS